MIKLSKDLKSREIRIFLSSTFQDMNEDRYEDALALGRKVNDLRTKTLGTNHPHTQASMAGLANTLEKMGSPKEALQWREDVFQSRKETLEPGDELLIKAANELIATADLCQMPERAVEAKKFIE